MSVVWKSHEVRSVCWAEFSSTKPTFLREKARVRGRRGQGIKYERLAQQYLQELYGASYFASPWIRYREYENEILRWCQPDGLIIEPELGIITLVEIKYSHTYEAYRQLYRCYSPVIQKLFPPELWTFRYVEVVKWYDQQLKLPVETQLCKLPHYASEDSLGVHIWSP